jgi:hypothetical protein
VIKLLAKLREIPDILLGDSVDYEQSDIEYGRFLQLDCPVPSYVEASPSKFFSDSVVIQLDSRSLVMHHGVDFPELLFNPISYEELILNTGVDENIIMSSEEATMQHECHCNQQSKISINDEAEEKQTKSVQLFHFEYRQRRQRNDHSPPVRLSSQSWKCF